MFSDSEENRTKVFDAIDRANAAGYGGLKITHLPRPHPEREHLKRTVTITGVNGTLSRARIVYRSLLESAVKHRGR